MNLVCELLHAGADDAPAAFHLDTEISHGVLRRQADQVGQGLLAFGCHKQDRVGIFSENNLFFVVGYLGVIRAGLVAVPIQTDASPESIKGIISDAGIRVILVSRRAEFRLRNSLAEFGVRIVNETELQGFEANNRYEYPEIDPERDLAALMFTSGSTGKPKGVMITHNNILCNTRDIVDYIGLGPTDRAMVVLPFHYCFGLSILHTLLAAGGSLVLNNQFLYPEKMLQEMRSRACTGLAGVPSTYQILLRKSRFKDLTFPSLRWLQQAGGKLPNSFIKEIMEAFPQVRLFVMYGQTEATARLSYLPPERLGDKTGSIGTGLPSTRLEVLRNDGNPVARGTGEAGEIVASGGNVALGYWNDPDETAKYFRNGKLHTGDLAKVDEDGFIYIVEREREMIKSGGNRISSKEIEDVIAERPEVVEVAVVGVTHEILGEAIGAVVVLAPGARLQTGDLLEHCRRRLPGFKVPQSVIIVPGLPHTANGKVVKSKLREMAERVDETPSASAQMIRC